MTFGLEYLLSFEKERDLDSLTVGAWTDFFSCLLSRWRKKRTRWLCLTSTLTMGHVVPPVLQIYLGMTLRLFNPPIIMRAE